MRVTATCELLQEAEKVFLGTAYTSCVPQQVLRLLEQKGNMWLTVGRMGRYQAILLNNPKVSLKTVSKLNPASLLLEFDSATLIHDCAEIPDEVYSSRTDLQDHPLEEADWTPYADMETVIWTKETERLCSCDS